MRAIFIDVFAQNANEVDIPGTLTSLYIQLDAQAHGFDAIEDVESVRVLGGNYLWFDKGGFEKDGLPCFQVAGYDGYIPGNGVMLAVDSLGKPYPCTINILNARALLTYIPTKYSTGTREAPDTDLTLTYVQLGAPILRDVP